MAQTAVNLQNNTLMYGPINGKAWYTRGIIKEETHR